MRPATGERLYNTGIQNAMFSYYQEEDETSFQLVDNRTKQRPNMGGFKPIVRAVRLPAQRGRRGVGADGAPVRCH